tara:strand:- start:82 stop:249 length:168 start_codon:yes stop_codon:yes gene_type:complete
MAIHPGENLGLLIRYAMPSASQPLELGRSKDPPSKQTNINVSAEKVVALNDIHGV